MRLLSCIIIVMQTNGMAYHLCVNSEACNSNNCYCIQCVEYAQCVTIMSYYVTVCQTSFPPLCQVLHEKFTNWYGSIFAALLTFSNVCIILVVWAFRRLDGWKSTGQYLIYRLLTISHTNSKKYDCYMRKL